MQALKIIGFATAAAVVYGVLHDQVTAHLCVEYFTVAHPPVFPTDSPFWLAIGWGTIATWWVGMALGVMLAAASRLGPWPKLSLSDIRLSIVLLMVASGVIALAAGAIGALLISIGVTGAMAGWNEMIPAQKWVAFTASAWAHSASYVAGIVGGLIVVARSIEQRRMAAIA